MRCQSQCFGGLHHPGFSFKHLAIAKWIFSAFALCSGAVVESCTRISRNKLQTEPSTAASRTPAVRLRVSCPGNPALSAAGSNVCWESCLPFQQWDLLLSQRGALGPGVEVLAQRGSFSLCPGWWWRGAQPASPKTRLSTASLTSVSSREATLSTFLLLERNC